MASNLPPRPNVHNVHVNLVYLDLREEYLEDRLVHVESLKQVQIDPHRFQTAKLETAMTKDEEEELIHLLQKNVELFFYNSSNMLGVNVNNISYCFTFNNIIKSIIQ